MQRKRWFDERGHDALENIHAEPWFAKVRLNTR